MKWHNTEDGPRECNAQPGNCPITRQTGGDHYTSKEEAQQAYETKNQHLSVFSLRKKPTKNDTPKKYAPHKDEIEPVTIEEIHNILYQRYTVNNKSVPAVAKGPVVLYGINGSSMYNLHHGKSDRDIFIITGADKKSKTIQKIDNYGDTVFMNVEKFSLMVNKGSTQHIDMMHTPEFHYHDRNLVPYLSSLRFNEYQYVSESEDLVHTNIKVALNKASDGEEFSRIEKKVKISLRTATMQRRVEDKGNHYTATFTEDQREAFYRNLHFLTQEIISNPNENAYERVYDFVDDSLL